MAELDQAVVNLERFVGLLVTATSAVGQVEDHVVENGQHFDRLEQAAGEEGGGLNDHLERLGTTLETDGAEAVDALSALTRAAADAQQDVGGVRSDVAQAAADLDQAAGGVQAQLEQADTQLDAEGFAPLHDTLEAAGADLETSRQDGEHALAELSGAISGFGKEAESAWDEADAELDDATAALATEESAIEAEAQDGVHAFQAGADALDDACASLVSDVDQIYDALDAGVQAQGQEWDHEVDAAVQQAAAFVSGAREQRLEAAASLVQETALSGLDQEYESVGTLLDAAASPVSELEPLSADLVKARAVAGQIDELMSALS